MELEQASYVIVLIVFIVCPVPIVVNCNFRFCQVYVRMCYWIYVPSLSMHVCYIRQLIESILHVLSHDGREVCSNEALGWLALKRCDYAKAISLQRNCAVFLWLPGHQLVQQTSRLDRIQHCTYVLSQWKAHTAVQYWKLNWTMTCKVSSSMVNVTSCSFCFLL